VVTDRLKGGALSDTLFAKTKASLS